MPRNRAERVGDDFILHICWRRCGCHHCYAHAGQLNSAARVLVGYGDISKDSMA